MLNESVLKLLREKINNEYFRSNVFLDISGWAGDLSLKGVQGYFQNLSKKSLANVYELTEYVNQTGNTVDLLAIPEGVREFDNVEDVFVYVSELEKQHRADLNNILDYCLAEKDFATYATIEPEVKNQHSEEFFLKSVLDKLALFGPKGQGLFLLDKELAEAYPIQPLAE